MTILNFIDYYRALNGESTLSHNQWYINYDKRHAFKIFSDFDIIDEHSDTLIFPPNSISTDTINIFSSQLSQKFDNTKIVENGDVEQIELELGDRVITLVVDQSGSMTWNDSTGSRFVIAREMIDKIKNNYPGNIYYNLIAYGAKFVNVLLFAVIEEDIDTTDTNSLSSILSLDIDENFKGIRIVRTTQDIDLSYNPGGGTLVADGFVGKALDEDLVEGQTYYYWVYTYDRNLKISKGKRIKVVPRSRNVPRGISAFKSFVEGDSIYEGIPLIGKGVARDDNTIGIWHFGEGRGTNVFDFSGNDLNLSLNEINPIWYDSDFSPAGDSALFFNGIDNKALVEDTEGVLHVSWGASNTELSILVWICSYDNSDVQCILEKGQGGNKNYSLVINVDGTLTFDEGSGVLATTSVLIVERYKWQYIGVTYDGSNVVFYINEDTETVALAASTYNLISDETLYIGIGEDGNNPFNGKITEVSIHNIVRESDYINNQLNTISIKNGDGAEIDREYLGRKEDNGDRLVVLKYTVPTDYNFSGGNVRIVRNDEHIPTWEEDGDEIYYSSASDGTFYISDSNEFVLGTSYYYRIYSQNENGNYSFSSDSMSLKFVIPIAGHNEDKYFPLLDSSIPSPAARVDVPLITSGNKKICLKWRQPFSDDDRIKKIKIYYSSSFYPVVNSNGRSNGELVFEGDISDNVFVHRNLENDKIAYYTLINVDRYGRASGYNSNKERIEDPLCASAIPSSSSNENTIPLIDVENLHYELVDNNSISIIWDMPPQNLADINAYFDQTIVVYASITDQFGEPISEDSPINMYLTARITRDTQADDVFSDKGIVEFEDKESYMFDVERTDDGVLKGTLAMTTNADIMASIKEASFSIQVKSYIPREGYTSISERNSMSTESLAEYASAVEKAIEEIEGAASVSSSTSNNNIFEFYSKKINIIFTNPWELELINKNNSFVYERCYYQKTDPITKIPQLQVAQQKFDGIYMKASHPFVARAKVKYKGSAVISGSVDVAVWDAKMDGLCQGAGSPGVNSYVGEKINISSTILPPSNSLPLISSTEEVVVSEETITTSISYVDIPLYAPSTPQAVRLFVKGSRGGYNSVKDMYIVFQNILKIDIQARSPVIDGTNTAEQQAQVYIVNPDYSDITRSFDRSLITYPVDNTVVQWKSRAIQGSYRSIYSIDNVPITNGVYSYTRNGVARNVFMGPIQESSDKIEEIHEISAVVVYNGLSATAKQYIYVEYIPESYNIFAARFLMEVDGGWIGRGLDSRWGGAGWKDAEKGIMWTDGKDYRRIKISRNPRVATISQFGASSCFRDCAAREDSEILELSSGQIVHIITGDNDVEILHGEIYEEYDPYTGEHSLRIGDDGFVENGEADIELNDQEDSDITYFYIRINKFSPSAKAIHPIFEIDEEPINKCLCLNSPDGLFKKDLPKWEPVIYLSGTTTVSVNNKPLTLTGGGTFYTGIPPCPICFVEPLELIVKKRWVVNGTEYFYVDNNNFKDSDGETLIHHDSDVYVKVEIQWKREPVPEGTPVYILIGDKNTNNLFVSDQDTYYAETESDGRTYITAKFYASRVAEETTYESIEIFSVYDENGKTDRKRSIFLNLEIDRENETIPTEIEQPEPITEIFIPIVTPYSYTVERFNINENTWDTVRDLPEARGDMFAGNVGNYIYVMGGMKGNDLNISERNDRYDVITDTWSDKEEMITPRFGGMTIVYNNDIYTIGGIGIDASGNGQTNVSIAMEVYHIDTNEWEELEHLPIISEGEASEEKLGVAYGVAQLIKIGAKYYIYVLCGIRSIINDGESVQIQKYNDRILRYSISDNLWDYSDVLYTDELLAYCRISPLSFCYDDNSIIVFNGAYESTNSNFIYYKDVFTIFITDSLERQEGTRYVQFGNSILPEIPEPKYLSSIVRYETNPSGDPYNYFIVGGFNEDSSSLDIMERVVTDPNGFVYETSYDYNNPSIQISSMLVGKHGMSSVLSYALEGSDLVPYIYIIGGYTTARDNESADIIFDI